MKTRFTSCILAAAWLLTCPPAAAAEPTTQEAADPETSAKALVELLARGTTTIVVRSFDDRMKKALPARKLRQVWKSLVAEAGPFGKTVGTRLQTLGAHDVVFVTCQFARARIDAKVVYNSDRRVAGLFFVKSAAPKLPPYAKRTTFREKKVMVGTGRWKLPGTLTLPVGSGPLPAVVLVHGYGPHDRDETLGPNKPFRDLAWGLATRRVAVLRYEKRTKEHAAGMRWLPKGITVKEETIDDALVAVALLRETEGIAADGIFVLGHSLGGMLAPRIAKRDPTIAGLVIMAGPTRPLEDVLLAQTRYLALLDGSISEQENKLLDIIAEQVTKAKDPNLSHATPPRELPLGVPASYWLDLRGYDPVETAKAVARPMLILQGERDFQVTAEDFERWKEALSARKDVQFRSYPKLNHAFMPGGGKPTAGEFNKAGNVAQNVVVDIAQWIKALHGAK